MWRFPVRSGQRIRVCDLQDFFSEALSSCCILFLPWNVWRFLMLMSPPWQNCDLISNHRLVIETGRYMRPYKKPNERFCPLCKKAEDEKHFLVSCPVYQEKRKSLFECLHKEFKIPIVKMSTENILMWIIHMNGGSEIKWRLILAAVNAIYAIA